MNNNEVKFLYHKLKYKSETLKIEENDSFSEIKRLNQDKNYLLKKYSKNLNNLLFHKNIGKLPYELISDDIKRIKLYTKDGNYQIHDSLKNIFNTIAETLSEKYNKLGIIYEPEILVRANNYSNNILDIEKTNYTDTASTNLIADLDLKETYNTEINFNNSHVKTIRDYDQINSENKLSLPSLKVSIFSNPLGVAGIGISSDNKLIIKHRSSNVSTYNNQLGPSSSGYVSWSDLDLCKTNSLDELLQNCLKREIFEELNIKESEISKLYPLGLYREFYRAGMPQGFYYFKINLSFKEILERIDGSKSSKEFLGILEVPIQKIYTEEIIKLFLNKKWKENFETGLELEGLLVSLLNSKNNIF